MKTDKNPLRRLADYLYWKLILRQPRVRSWLIRLYRPDREVHGTLFGAPLTVHAQKEFGYDRALRLAASSVLLRDEAPVLTSLALLLRPDDAFVDVGANVGLYSSVLSKLSRIYPRMRFYAVEPNPDTLKRLRQTLAGLPVRILPYALSNQEGNLRFTSGLNSLVFSPVGGPDSGFSESGQTITVATARLDQILRDETSIVLKIDVEGHEREVLEGSKALFESQRIKLLYLDGYSDSGIPKWLRSLQFQLFNGQTLKPESEDTIEHSLLAIHASRLLP